MRHRHGRFVLSILTMGILFISAGVASAKRDDATRVIPLSSSGFELAHSLAFSPDGQTLAVGGTSGIYLLDARRQSKVSFITTNSWARSVTFLDDSMLAAGLFDKTIKLWRVPHQELAQTFTGHQGWVRSVSVSHDGGLIASASDDDTVRVWTADGTPRLVIDTNASGARAVALSPDGQIVAAAVGDNTIRIWRVEDGELLETLSGHTDWIRCLAFSPDGRRLASGSFDTTVRLWSMPDGAPLRTLKGHTSSVLGVAFSPDGETLASGSVDTSVRLWHAADGSPIGVLQGHTDFVYAVAFSPDGEILASGGADNAVWLWDVGEFGAPDPNTAEGQYDSPSTSSDCRQCHHRRGAVEPARVIDLSCEGCHSGGAGLSWCTAFPRSTTLTPKPVAYHHAGEVSGVPVGGDKLAVLIAAPGNGETLYVKGEYMAPEVIGGKIFYADSASITNVEVRLDVFSGEQKTASFTTQPTPEGDFTINAAINLDRSPPFLSSPGTKQCLACHGEYTPELGLPVGMVHLVVTATAPDGQIASDARWVRVDSSSSAVVPVQVVDALSGHPLPALPIQASTVLYQWRNRFGNTISASDGKASLDLEKSSQVPTVYSVSIPPTVINGTLYTSQDPILVTLKPDAVSYPEVTMTAHSQIGQISGDVSGAPSSTAVEGQKVWAVRLPGGPAYLATIDARNKFVFESIPVGQYRVAAEPSGLAGSSLFAAAQSVDLRDSPLGSVSLGLAQGEFITGSVTAQRDQAIPFAWAVLNEGEAWVINPVSGEFMAFEPASAHASVLTISAPGYYSQSMPVDPGSKRHDFQLVERPETRHVAWGAGTVTLPPETSAEVNGLDMTIDHGWLWGEGSSSKPLTLHVRGFDVMIPGGQFALEVPAGGTGFLYMEEGAAQLKADDQQAPLEVKAGEMIALGGDTSSVPADEAVVAILHPVLPEAPLPKVIEPSLGARIQDWLVKAGIGTAQFITLIIYILSLVALVASPVLVISWRRRRNRSAPEEKRNG